MLKLVGDEVRSIDQFMNRYRVRRHLSLGLLDRLLIPMKRWIIPLRYNESGLAFLQLLNTPVKPGQKLPSGSQKRRRCVSYHSGQRRYPTNLTELYYVYGRIETTHAGQRSATSSLAGSCHWLCKAQRKQRLGRKKQDGRMV